jgi:putative ABC transport system substrate-binding protein
MISRRRVVSGVGAALLVAPAAVQAQPVDKVYRLGILSHGGPPPPGTASHLHVIEVLREFGYIEGRNLVVERRYAEGKTDRLPGWHENWFESQWTTSLSPQPLTWRRMRPRGFPS